MASRAITTPTTTQPRPPKSSDPLCWLAIDPVKRQELTLQEGSLPEQKNTVEWLSRFLEPFRGSPSRECVPIFSHSDLLELYNAYKIVFKLTKRCQDEWPFFTEKKGGRMGATKVKEKCESTVTSTAHQAETTDSEC